MSSGDIAATLIELGDFIVENLRDGNRVCLDELGTFSISLKCAKATDRKKVRSRDVSFSHINFQPAASLNKQMKDIKLRRYPYSRQKLQTTPEERMQLLEEKLRTDTMISVKTYGDMTGLSEYSSRKELSELTEKGILLCKASRHFKLYYKEGTVNR